MKKINIIKIYLPFFILLFLLTVIKVDAQLVWYVSKSGNDITGDGSKENPFASIQRGVDAAATGHGDTVKVAGGIYYETIITPNRQGIDLIGSYDPDTWTRDLVNCRTIVDPGIENDGIMINYSESKITVLDGFTVRNSYWGFYRRTFPSIQNTYIINCIAENCFYGLFALCPISVFIENSIFRNCEQGIHVLQSGHVTVDNCVFYNITYRAFFAYNFPMPEYVATIRHSTFYNCYQAIRLTERKAKYHIVKNNIIVNCTDAFTYYLGDPSNILLTHNNFYNNVSNITGAIDDGTNIYLDPEFVNELTYDFHLTNSSQCIGAGTTENILPYDIENNPRPNPPSSNPDLGAYENPLAYPRIEIIVEIDIKPGSYPNSINLKSKGVVPVAILTKEDFDVTNVDPETVLFADAVPVHWTLEDVNYDGNTDMLLHFKTQELSLCGTSTEAKLTGETYEGIPIEGTDKVNIVPKGKK